MFDGVIAINREELKYASSVVNGNAEMLYAPMGIADLGAWPYLMEAFSRPARIAYYVAVSEVRTISKLPGGASDLIMPEVWDRFPETTFWLAGSNLQGPCSDGRTTLVSR